MLEVDLHQTRPTTLDASLACAPGELLAIVGPSGTGKSTLLKSIAGLLDGARGRVRVGDSLWLDTRQGIDVPAHRRAVGFVFQSYALFPHMNVLENVMAAATGTRAQRAAQARQTLASVHMAGLEQRTPQQLSGGQQQRVGLARALVRQPEVLLLDEPFSAVDQLTKERLYEELAELRARLAIPTVLVTHSIPEAQLLADRMVVLRRGRTLQTGDPEYVYRHPAESDVARLMGHKNVFTAELAHSPQGPRLAWQGLVFEVASTLPAGRVAFSVASDDVRLVDETSDPVNAVGARVLKMIPVGGDVRVFVELSNGAALVLSAPKHILARRGVANGQQLRLALPVAAIHVMPG
jgi:molybdate transport system ATP-binding protein